MATVSGEQLRRLLARMPAGTDPQVVVNELRRRGHTLDSAAAGGEVARGTSGGQPPGPAVYDPSIEGDPALLMDRPVGHDAMADFGRFTSTGGIGGMGGIEEHPGMGMMSPDQRGDVRENALGNYGTQAIIAALFGGAGAVLGNPALRAGAGALASRAPFGIGASVRAVGAASRAASAAAAAEEAAGAGASADRFVAGASRARFRPPEVDFSDLETAARGAAPATRAGTGASVQSTALADRIRLLPMLEESAAPAARATASAATAPAAGEVVEQAVPKGYARVGEYLRRVPKRAGRATPKAAAKPAAEPASARFRPRGASAPELARRAATQEQALGHRIGARPPAPAAGDLETQLLRSVQAVEQLPAGLTPAERLAALQALLGHGPF